MYIKFTCSSMNSSTSTTQFIGSCPIQKNKRLFNLNFPAINFLFTRVNMCSHYTILVGNCTYVYELICVCDGQINTAQYTMLKLTYMYFDFQIRSAKSTHRKMLKVLHCMYKCRNFCVNFADLT